MHRLLKVLTVAVAFISIILVSRDPKYLWSGIEKFWNYFSLTDDPIFRNLANSTTILIEDLVKFKFPASSNVIELRGTSNFLSDVISRNSIATSSSPALYLLSLGDKSYIAGIQIEKMYSTGSFALGELSNELQDIRQNLPQPQPSYHDSILSQKGAQYFAARFDQILRLVTRFRDKLADIEKTIQEIQRLYRGYDNVQGFSKIIEHFEENKQAYEQIYDMQAVQQELDSERKQMDQLMDVDREVVMIVQSIDLFRQNVASFMKEVIYLSNKKIVTEEDSQVLEDVIETVKMAKKVWNRMDNMDDILRLEG